MNRLLTICCVMAAFQSTVGWQDGDSPASRPACEVTGALMRLDGVPEASGLAVSASTAGRLWAVNDSGRPEILAINKDGAVTGRVSLSGAELDDWEAIAAGPCGGRSCLYVADIGDNDATRTSVTVYRLREPTGMDAPVEVEATIRATYPDRPHDAETLLATPDGRLFIVTKGDTGAVALYRFPDLPSANATVRLERVGDPLWSGQPDEDARVTDGAISADGSWVALRTGTALTFYQADRFLAGDFQAASRVDLSGLGEPQGEAVAFGPAGSNHVYVGGEGGGDSRPGTLAVLSCAM